MSTSFYSTGLWPLPSPFSDHQQLEISISVPPSEQPLPSPVGEGDPAPINFRKKKHVGRSCVECHESHQKCDNNRPCKRCTDRREECIDSTSPELRRRPTASQLKEARSRVIELEAVVQMITQREDELKKKCHRQAQLLRVHGYEEPLPYGHPTPNSIDQSAKSSCSISINHADLEVYRAPSVGIPTPAASSSANPSSYAREDDAASNSSYDPSYNDSVHSSGEGSSVVSGLEAPLSDVSIASGSENIMYDGMFRHTLQYQRQQYLEPPRVNHRGHSRSDSSLGSEETKPYHRHPLDLTSTDNDLFSEYYKMRGSDSALSKLTSLVPTSHSFESAAAFTALSHGEIRPPTEPAPGRYAATPSDNGAPSAFGLSTFEANSLPPGASSIWDGEK